MNALNKTTIIIAFGTLVIGLLFGWLIFGVSGRTENAEHNHESMSASETIWTCSMHPQIRQNEPGNCPLCGMDLIPLESSREERDPMAVSMSPTAMQLAKVQTLVVGQSDVEKSIRLNGKVKADDRLLYTQSFHISGRIERLSVNFTGEYISEGQEIAAIYSPDLVTAQEEMFEALKVKELHPELFTATTEKLKNWKLTEKQIEQIIATGKTIDQFPILANVSGYVTKKRVNLGDYVKQGEALYEITDLSKVWVLFDVYESDMTWIQNGASISYTIQSIPGRTFNGKVTFIDPVIDPITRVAKARIETANADLLLKPEMFVSGTIKAKVSSKNTSITVPKTAVMWTGKRSVVYVMHMTENDVSFRMRQVTLGPELGESYVIEAGLEAGEEIAVNGTFSIDAAAQLAGKPSMMNPEGGVAMTGHNHGSIKANSEPSKSEMKMTDEPQISQAEKAMESEHAVPAAFEAVLNVYFLLKTALTKSDVTSAEKYVTQLSDAFSGMDMSIFKGTSHEKWMAAKPEIDKNLEQMSKSGNIEELRIAFNPLSASLISISEEFTGYENEIYIQFCPMADHNQGAYWLSNQEQITNPYFGRSMLKCGSTKSILK